MLSMKGPTVDDEPTPLASLGIWGHFAVTHDVLM